MAQKLKVYDHPYNDYYFFFMHNLFITASHLDTLTVMLSCSASTHVIFVSVIYFFTSSQNDGVNVPRGGAQEC